jgi:hypothetical protein
MMKASGLFMAVGMLAASATVSAEDWNLTVAPSLDFAFKRSSYEFSGSASGAFEAEPAYTSLIPSIAIGYGPIYGVLSYDTQMGLWQSTESGGGTFQTNTYDRSEASLTLGYRVLRTVNVFVGYVSGNSNQTQVIYSGSPVTPDPISYKFHEEGAYLGISYGHQFGDKGTLSMSAAYGKMDGRLELDSTGLVATFDSSAPGFSASLGWSGPLTGSMVYRVGLKYTQYNFDISTATVGPIVVPLTNPIEIKESIMSFSMGIANYF